MIVFAHANGFTPGSYKQLIKNIDEEVKCIKLTPLRRTFTHRESLSSWHDYSEELLNDLINLPKPIIGVGHSMGAICLQIAAVRDPNLLKAIVLIEPTLLQKRIIALSRVVPQWISRKLNPVAGKAFRRTDLWNSQEDAFKELRGKRFFENVSDQVLNDYLDSGLVDTANGQKTLLYSKYWEEHCFTSVVNPWPWIRRSRIPALGIYGENSDLITPDICEKWKKLSKNTTFTEIPGTGHLAPLERPELVATKINSFIKDLPSNN